MVVMCMHTRGCAVQTTFKGVEECCACLRALKYSSVEAVDSVHTYILLCLTAAAGVCVCAVLVCRCTRMCCSRS
jgi:hypothetical protein